MPYVIGGTLQEAPLSEAARKELRRLGKDAETGKARSNKNIPSLGPGLLLDDDGDVLAREAVLRALGCAACIYTSHSYGTIKKGAAEASKGGRVVLCLNREYSPDEHQLLWDGINHLLGGGFDKAGRTRSQCYGMHARRSTEAPYKRVVIEGAALNVDALVALGRSLQPAKKAPAAAGKPGNRPDQAATIEQIRSAVEFLSGYLDEHPEVLVDEPDWMKNIARPFAHQAWRCPDQREELERLLDELSRKAPGYDREENAVRFARYVDEAPEREGRVGLDGPRTIASFFLLVRELGWKGYVPTDAAWDEPGHEAANRQLIQQQIIADPELFNRNGLLVRLRVPETDEMVEGTEWKGDMPGTTMAKPADVMLCAERLVWMRNGKQGPYRVHPPRPFVGDYIPQVGGQGARPLRGLTRLPHIGDNGNICCFSGYDPETGLYNDKPINLGIPPTVSRDEARQLGDKLLYPFSQYTFKNPEQARATALAAIITILERPYLPHAPMFIFRSAMAGTGKGKLGRALTELAFANAPAKVTWGGGPEEFEKRLAALLLQTPSAILIDNANGMMIKGDLLESIITEGYADIRPLGHSEIIRVHNRAFLMLTGNNPIITGDMARRALPIDVEPKSPDPDRDRYPFDPVEYVGQHRKDLLEAAFSIMRAFRQAGMPHYPELPAVGSFKEWSRKARDLVYWLTDCDVSEGFHLNKAEDPHRQNDASLLEALYDLYFDKHKSPGSKEFKSADVMAVYERVKQPHGNATPSERAVYSALNEVLGDRKVNSKNLGYWGRRANGAHCGDFVLEARHDKNTNANVFTVKCTNLERAARRGAAALPQNTQQFAEAIQAKTPDPTPPHIDQPVAKKQTKRHKDYLL